MADESATDAMASDYINVALMSGRAAQVPVIMDRPLKRVKLGRILDVFRTASAAGMKSGDTLTLQVRQTRLASHNFGRASAALRGDGSVVTWGGPYSGGDSSRVQEQLKKVQHIQATEAAFAAVLDNGSVVTWGHWHRGGDSSTVQEELKNVQHIQAAKHAFAAVLDNGSVVTWGDPHFGGDSSRVQEQLKNV